jgi:GxxExxY protein
VDAAREAAHARCAAHRTRAFLPRSNRWTVIGGFFEVYTHLGYGLLETVYAAALRRELESRGLRVEREVWIDVLYKGDAIAKQRIDMIINDCVIVEIKATEGPALRAPTAVELSTCN